MCYVRVRTGIFLLFICLPIYYFGIKAALNQEDDVLNIELAIINRDVTFCLPFTFVIYHRFPLKFSS